MCARCSAIFTAGPAKLPQPCNLASIIMNLIVISSVY